MARSPLSLDASFRQQQPTVLADKNNSSPAVESKPSSYIAFANSGNDGFKEHKSHKT
jgi:hypothetical protein